MSNPPLSATGHFTLRVKGSVKRVVLYGGPFRRRTPHFDVKLGTARVRHGKVKVKLPRGLGGSAYYLIVCPAGRNGGCAASKRPMVVAPKAAGLLRTVSPSIAPGPAAAAIGEAGGTLTVSSPGGRVVLTVPSNSLPNDVYPQCDFQNALGFWQRSCPSSATPTGDTVTLTPLSAVSGLSSLGSFVAGAQLAPAGTLLMHGATLTIHPAHPIPARRLAVVVYSGTGTAAYEAPFVLSHGQVAVPLGSLDGGLALLERPAPGGGHHRTSRADHPGRSPKGARAASAPGPEGDSPFYGQLIGGELKTLVESGHDLGDGSVEDRDMQHAINSTFDDWHNDIIANEIPDALNNDAAGAIAMRDLLNWARYSELAGYPPKQFPPQVMQILRGFYNRAQQRCAQTPGYSPDQMHQILEIVRNIAMVDRPLANRIPWAELTACASFTATFDSTITTVFGGQDHGTQVSEYRVVIPLTMKADGSGVSGQGQGSYPQASGAMYSDPLACGSGGSFISHDDELSGNGVTAQVPLFTLPSVRIGGPDSKLELILGQPSETYHFYDTGASACTGSAGSRALPLWFGDFLSVHQSELDGTSGAIGDYVFDLVPDTGQTISRRDYARTWQAGDETKSEHTTITVTHTPGRFTTL